MVLILSMKLRFMMAAALCVPAIFLCGCDKGSGDASTNSKAELMKLGFVVKQPEEPWFQLEWKFADQAAKQDGFQLIKIGAADGDKALAAIDNLAGNGAKGLVICTPDVKLGPAIAKSADDHDLKLIAVDDRFVDADGKPMESVHYLGVSAGKIGTLAGQTLAEQMKTRGWTAADTALCAVTFDELPTAKERVDGAMAALSSAGFPTDKMYRAPEKTADIPGAIDAATILLTQHPDVKHWLICSTNDNGALGGVRATESRQIPAPNVCGVGINGTDCIAEFEKADVTGFYASVLLAPRDHGFKTADMLYKWVKDNVEPPLDTRTTGTLITRDNYVQVRKDQGITE